MVCRVVARGAVVLAEVVRRTGDHELHALIGEEAKIASVGVVDVDQVVVIVRRKTAAAVTATVHGSVPTVTLGDGVGSKNLAADGGREDGFSLLIPGG